MTRIETEAKLQAPAQFDLRHLLAGSNGFQLSPLHARRVSTVYYDSDDFRLLRWGCSLRYRRGEGWTLKLPGPSSDGGLAREEHEFSGESKQPPPEALELAAAYLRGKSVAPVARLRTVRTSSQVLGVDGSELAEVADDDVRVMEDGRVAKRFREVEIELSEGAPRDVLDELVGWLQQMGAGRLDNTPKSARALGEDASQTPLPHFDLDRHSSAAALIQQALSSSVERLIREDAVVRKSTTGEAVHKARVATRRLRSDLATFLPLIQHGWACELRDRLEWLTDQLGAVRDLDVQVQSLHRYAARLPMTEHAPIDRIVKSFCERRDRQREQLLAAMREPRYLQLLDSLVDAATNPRLLPNCDVPAVNVLAQLMHDPWKKVCEAIECAQDEASFGALHQARIKAKRCRYACEAVAPIAGKKATKLAERMEKLQKVLGDYHDAVVLQQQLHEYRSDPHTAFAAGALTALASADAEEAVRQWPAIWRKADKKKRRFWQ